MIAVVGQKNSKITCIATKGGIPIKCAITSIGYNRVVLSVDFKRKFERTTIFKPTIRAIKKNLEHMWKTGSQVFKNT